MSDSTKKPVEFYDKHGVIPVNTPTCNKCGKMFLDCKCAQQKGEKMPTFEGQRVDVEWVNKALLYAGEGRTNTIKPDLLANAINKHFAASPPAASEERGMREVARLCAEDVNAINFNRGHMLKDNDGNEAHVMPTEEMAKVIEWRLNAALQSAPSSLRAVSSGYLRELDRMGKGQQDIPKSALEKLRELEAKLLAEADARDKEMGTDGDDIRYCIAEIRAIFAAPAPRPAEQD